MTTWLYEQGIARFLTLKGEKMGKKRSLIWVYVALAILMFIPLYTEKPYDPRQTSDVIKSLLMKVTDPYAAFAPIFHIGTIALVILMILLKEKSSRIFTGYFGINFLVIAFVNSIGTTEKYGRVVMTSTLILCLIVGDRDIQAQDNRRFQRRAAV